MSKNSEEIGKRVAVAMVWLVFGGVWYEWGASDVIALAAVMVAIHIVRIR